MRFFPALRFFRKGTKLSQNLSVKYASIAATENVTVARMRSPGCETERLLTVVSYKTLNVRAREIVLPKITIARLDVYGLFFAFGRCVAVFAMSSLCSSTIPSCPKMRTKPKSRILEALSKFAETSRRGAGSPIGDPEQSSPSDHPFRPAGAPELLCSVAVVIAEQAAQSLTTSHLPVGTADAFFRFEQRVPEPLMVALSAIMMDELSDGTA